MRTYRLATASVVTSTLVVCGLTLACAYPESSTRGLTESPSIVVVGAPNGAVLFVDGIQAGLASNFSGDKRLAVLPGRHVVELKSGDRVLVKREVFVDSQGIKTVDFTGVAP